MLTLLMLALLRIVVLLSTFVDHVQRFLDILLRLVPLKPTTGVSHTIVNTYNMVHRIKYLRKLSAFDEHVRFPKRKRIHVLVWIDVRQTMVDKPMSALITSDGVDDIQEFGIGFHTPVVNGDGGCWVVFPKVTNSFRLSHMIGNVAMSILSG